MPIPNDREIALKLCELQDMQAVADHFDIGFRKVHHAAKRVKVKVVYVMPENTKEQEDED